MRKLRIALVWAVVLLVGLTGTLPQVMYAQDEQPTTGTTTLFLPTIRGGAQQISEAHDPAQIVVYNVPANQQVAAGTFWTRARMVAAAPLDVLRVSKEQVNATASGAAAQAVGPRGSAPASLPDPKAASLAMQQYAAEWARIDAENAAPPANLQSDLQAAGVDQIDTYASVPPFVSYYINDNTATWTSFPWITMGRIFFQIPGTTGTYACSATAAYGRAIWTAGHCVYTTGKGWSYNMYFVPAYRNGAYPYGSFTVKSMTTTSGWYYNNNLAFDIGMAAVNDMSGLKLSQWVGSVGFLYNASAGQLFHAFGYPGNYSAGQYLVTCASSTYKRDTIGTPNPIGIGCDMGSGSSGGAWMVGYAPFKAGLTNYINSVVSYSYATKPLELYGPYFGDAAKQLYDWAKLQ